MPDRQTPPPPDDAREHEPLPPDYPGLDRRRATGTELHKAIGAAAAGGAAGAEAGKESREPEWLRKLPTWAQILFHLGPFSIICFIFLGGMTCVAKERSTDRAYDRADRLEEREMQRAREAENSRNMNAITAKFEALMSEIRAFSAKVDANGDRVMTARLALEQTAAKLEALMTSVLAELKRLVPYRKPKDTDKPGPELEAGAGFSNPILDLFDHDPPKTMPAEPELAPRPRATANSPR